MAAQIFVVSGASGSGKTTLVRALQANDPQVRFSVSYTTRPSRPGEVDGQDYCFVTEEEFTGLIREGLLIEHVKQFGYYYGTSRKWIDEALQGSRDIIFDVEIQGAKALKEYFPQGNFVFILPPTQRCWKAGCETGAACPKPNCGSAWTGYARKFRKPPGMTISSSMTTYPWQFDNCKPL